MSYSDDRTWSDRYIPAISQIVGPHLVVPAPLEIDRRQGTDLIVLKARDMTIAARVRRAGYATRYPYDFTVRCRRDSGAETEMRKVLLGWADWMFYGFAHDTEPDALSRWYLLDLDIFRFVLARAGYRAGWRSLCEERDNGDGTHFLVFDVRRFAAAVIDSSEPVEPLAEFET